MSSAEERNLAQDVQAPLAKRKKVPFLHVVDGTETPVYQAATAGKPVRFKLAPYQLLGVFPPVEHFAFYGGVGCGKSFTLAHFAIAHILRFPHLTGFIGANTYDQLTQATLRELLYWLDYHGLEWVIDSMPPPHWGAKRKFKVYKNILSVRHPRTGDPVNVFTRTLSDPDALRGVEFSWYGIDETRDTPENTHDVILSRLRESEYVRGLIATTTNGKDWSWKRFVERADGKLYHAMHVPTKEAVRLGILTEAYLNTMLHTYSELMALQELEAQHVNVLGGRAYYAASDRNRSGMAPWGDTVPNPDRPLIVGCDFNFSPAPCIWMVGQLGPPLYAPDGSYWGDRIHWFGEVSMLEASTPTMTMSLIGKYPGFFYQVYGDASGEKGSTSNAGEHDYHQMGAVFSDEGCFHSINYDQANPRVRDRVENMNAKLCNAMGDVSMTYDPHACPNFDKDLDGVGWKPTIQKGVGKLDDGGDRQRTHASDGAGYAVWKLLPPGRRATLLPGIPSAGVAEIDRDMQGG